MKFLVFILSIVFLASSSFAAGYEEISTNSQALKNSLLLAITPQDHLLLSPERDGCSQSSPALVSLMPDGSPDANFRADKAAPPVSPEESMSYSCQISQVVTLRSGQLLEVANGYGLWELGAFLKKLNSDGTTDLRFGKSGFVTFYQLKRSQVLAVYEHDDESIYGVNVQCEGSPRACTSYLFRVLKNGIFDPNFGNKGFVVRNVSVTYDGNSNMAATEIRVVGDKIIVVERRHQFDFEVLLFQYDMKGNLVAGYKPDTGRQLRKIRNSNSDCIARSKFTRDFIYSVSGCESDNAAIVMRHHLDGELDKSFGNSQGVLELPLKLAKSQKIPFVNITDLANGEVAISTAIGWPAYSSSGTILVSVFTTHLDANGQLGKWGHGEKAMPGPIFFHAAKSVSDSKGRVILKLEDSWVVTTPMK